MAGDWIKMRPALLTSPKVNGIARTLESDRSVSNVLSTGFNGAMSEIVTRNVMRNVTVASLLVIWGAANEHTANGVFHNADLSDIDDMVGIPGFGLAMAQVGWAEFDESEGCVRLPNFNEYNTSGRERSGTAKTAAQRQREYRERKRNAESDVTDNVTSDVTRYRREEKSREESTPCSPPEGDHATPEQIDQIFSRAASDSFAGAFAMTFDWEPDRRSIDARLAQMGISLFVHPPLYADALAAFRNHHEASGKIKRKAQWESALASWIQRDIRKLESSQGSTASANNGDWSPPPLPNFPEED